MKAHLHRVAFISVALALGSAEDAFAGGVRIVEATGTQNLVDIASAVAAAPEGAVLLVGEGSYPGFTISGKSLSIFAVPDQQVDVDAPISVWGIAVNQTVVLSGIHVTQG